MRGSDAFDNRDDIDEDFFWPVPPAAKYDTYTPPEADHPLGQLSEFLGRPRSVVARGDEVPTYALMWIADLLGAL